MSGQPNVTWYADGLRAAITDADGAKWWLAPDGADGFQAVCDDNNDVRSGATKADVLKALLGERWRLWGEGR